MLKTEIEPTNLIDSRHICALPDAMSESKATAPTPIQIFLAFAAVYLIWGSTYFFIREALDGFPPLLLGGLRFTMAAIALLGWCAFRGERIWPGRELRVLVIVGTLLLFIGNGMVIWVEQTVPSSVVAIMIASGPLWFVLVDRPNWNVNFRSTSTIIGVVLGFAGVLLLFSDKIAVQVQTTELSPEIAGLLMLLLGSAAWAWGSIYSKRNPGSLSTAASTAWQMMVGGLLFFVTSGWRGEWAPMEFASVPTHAWWALAYLTVFGSIVAFSAYVWLLSVRPATQVSTYAYVNPVVAVFLGAYVGGEHISPSELLGLGVILGSVVLINLAKYRKGARAA